MRRITKFLLWGAIAVAGALALATIALHRGEAINAMWLVVAALCTYALGYRFYSKFIAAKVLTLDAMRATPAERLENGRDFVRTNKWYLFGHHFAAIAGPGPLVGPVLAAQFGYLPSTIWILAGAVFGGCVQDFVILLFSVRRDGKSLGQMARDEVSKVAGTVAFIAVISILIILLAVVALVVVNALRQSPWGTFTIGMTIPIALLMGVYLRFLRPGKVLEASIFGFVFVMLAVFGGQWVSHSHALSGVFTLSGPTLAVLLIIYGFAASAVPVWLLLAPRDYLSTFVKLGTIAILVIGIILIRPTLQMPALTRFIDGTGPVFAGSIFPFAFITVDSGAGMVGQTPQAAVATITQWGFPVTSDQMNDLAKHVGEQTLFFRTGGAPAFALGMAKIFSDSLGGTAVMAIWYHFAIMFEALFILTVLDAGTRVARFMVQDALGHVWAPMGRTSSYPSILVTSALVVAAWGYFLWQGLHDPLGGINSLWPLFGICNQLLAAVALCVATTIIVKMGKARYMWVTLLPLSWLVAVTFTASWQKIFHSNPLIGLLSHANQLLAIKPAPADLARKVFNDRLDAVVAGFLVVLVAVVVIESAMQWISVISGRKEAATREAPFVATQYAEESA